MSQADTAKVVARADRELGVCSNVLESAQDCGHLPSEHVVDPNYIPYSIDGIQVEYLPGPVQFYACRSCPCRMYHPHGG